MKRPWRILILALLLALVGVACGDSEPEEEPATTAAAPETTAAPATEATTAATEATTAATEATTAATEATTTTAAAEPVSLIYVSPNPLGVNNFLILGEVGTQRVAERRGGTWKTFESVDDSTRRANIEAAIDEAPDVIVLTTFTLVEMADEYSKANPDQKFIIIDACPNEPAPNLHCGVFREHEGAFLLGVMAGHLSEAKQIGSVAALDIPFFKRWWQSFAEGAQSVDPRHRQLGGVHRGRQPVLRPGPRQGTSPFAGGPGSRPYLRGRRRVQRRYVRSSPGGRLSLVRRGRQRVSQRARLHRRQQPEGGRCGGRATPRPSAGRKRPAQWCRSGWPKAAPE